MITISAAFHFVEEENLETICSYCKKEHNGTFEKVHFLNHQYKCCMCEHCGHVVCLGSH